MKINLSLQNYHHLKSSRRNSVVAPSEKTKTVLIVELSTSHTEIIEPFVRALKKCRIDIAIPEEGYNKMPRMKLFRHVHLINEKIGYKQVSALINQGHYDLVIYNSAQGKNVRNLVLKTFFNKSPVVGFHHNPINLVKSFTQKIINLKVKKYLVLADFNKDYVVHHGFAAEKVEAFYPVTTAMPVDFANNKLIAIPGVLEQDRRDYFGLIDIIKKNPKSFKGYQFALLGNSQTHDGPKIRTVVRESGLEAYFKFYDGYVPDEQLEEELQQSKFVMPLMHPNNRYFDVYLKTKISGAYNLAYAYQLPLLMHDSFKVVSEFSTNCVFYDFENLTKKLKARIELNRKFYAKFSSEVQSHNLMRFLFE